MKRPLCTPPTFLCLLICAQDQISRRPRDGLSTQEVSALPIGAPRPPPSDAELLPGGNKLDHIDLANDSDDARRPQRSANDHPSRYATGCNRSRSLSIQQIRAVADDDHLHTHARLVQYVRRPARRDDTEGTCRLFNPASFAPSDPKPDH